MKRLIINQLKIKNFGKFQDKTIELKPGINVVYGENESGKSTIFAFIRAMFFGIERQRGKAARTDDYWRYEPWNHPMLYDGVMKVTRDNRIFRIERKFCKAKREWHVIDETQGKELSEKEAEDIFLKDLTPSFYDNTISLPQKRTAASTTATASAPAGTGCVRSCSTPPWWDTRRLCPTPPTPASWW